MKIKTGNEKVIIVSTVLLTLTLIFFGRFVWRYQDESAKLGPAAIAISVSSPYIYSYNANGTLNESGIMPDSSSPYWWLNSGGQLVIENGTGRTLSGDTPLVNRWRLIYLISNPIDTDQGLHPQNIFRLISRSLWGNVRLETGFKITKDNWSKSPNQNASNGLLLMSHYLNGDTLYYAGIRVDGNAVIKKKYHGSYYTMAEKKVFEGSYKEGENKNLLPHDKWIYLRNETLTNQDETVTVRLFMRRAEEKNWTLLLEAVDRGNFGGTLPITEPGFAGIRTDFMDVVFRSFKAETMTETNQVL